LYPARCGAASSPLALRQRQATPSFVYVLKKRYKENR